MLLIQRLNQVQLLSLSSPVDFRIGDIRHLCVGNRCFCRPDRGALMHGRKKCTAIILNSAVSSRRRNGDETRQVFAFSTEPITNPRTNAGTDEI